MNAQVRLLFGPNCQLREGEIAIGLQPHEGAISRQPGQDVFHGLCLIDQVMILLNENRRPYGKVAVWDLDPETTLAAAIAAGAEVSTEICGDVADFTERGNLPLDRFRITPSSEILRAYIQTALGASLRSETSASESVKFWFETVNDWKRIEALASEFDTVQSFPCDMQYREVVDDVTLVWSEGFPLQYVSTDTFLWLRPLVGGWCHMFAGTIQEDPSFMRETLDIVRTVEKARLVRAKKHTKARDKWTLAADKRYLKSPQNYISMIMYIEVMEILARLAG